MAVAGKWSSLKGVVLNEAVRSALENSFNFSCMTPVQAAAIPPLLSCQDVSVDAETGSGKTLSFLVPIAQSLLFGREYQVSKKPSRATKALIILPTRELAAQVQAVAQRLFAALPGDVNPCAVIGGGAANTNGPSALADVKDMRLVVATPGRLNAELQAGALNVAGLEFLILDEADRLLDMGFDVALSAILARLPKQRRTGLYSATQTAGVEELARAGLRNPVRIAVKISAKGNGAFASDGGKEANRTPTSLTSYHHVVPQDDKLVTLCGLLSQRPDDKFIVYFLTCASVHYHSMLPLDRLTSLVGKRFSDDAEACTRPFFALHGKMMQKKRTRSLRKFASSTNGVLLCTDVAARGIDLPDVNAVVQFDAPQDPDVYVHRVGRTARLGRKGHSVIILAPSEDTYVEFLKLRKCPAGVFREEGAEFVGGDTDRLEKLCSLGGKVEGSDEEKPERKQVDALVRECTLTNRSVLDASEKAFLSFIRGYKEHKCGYILKLDNLDVSAVARSFRLLRMPKFHEFKKLKSKMNFKRDENVRIRDIPYKDAAQEAKRQKEIKEAMVAREKGKLEGKGKRKREAERQDAKRKQKKGGGKSKTGEEDEEDDFGLEAWQLKKWKRGKMSRKEFDELTAPGAPETK